MMIPYGRQDISQDDINSVLEVLNSDFLTQGPKVPEFEKVLANYCGSKFAIASNSATSSLHLACLALGVGKGDIVWTSPITFVASANCAIYCGAQVDFVDIDPRTYNLSAASLEQKLIAAKKKDLLPKVVIPVHLCGQPCEMERIHHLSKEYGFKIIEDASHAIGGKYKGQAIGNCLYSDITVFSFHPVKIITTAEGGVALTNSPELASKMQLLRSHGITRDPSMMTEPPHGPWYYQQIELGFNYRMTELQAALGISQMVRLDDFVKKRHERALRYFDGLKDLPVVLPYQHPDSYSAYHLFVIRLKLNMVKKTHKEVFEGLIKEGIGVNLHYIPLYFQPFHQLPEGHCPEAEQYYREAISVPMYSSLTVEKQDQVIAAIRKILVNNT